MYVAFHREIPPEIEKPEVVRWLDEMGRIGNSMVRLDQTYVCLSYIFFGRKFQVKYIFFFLNSLRVSARLNKKRDFFCALYRSRSN